MLFQASILDQITHAVIATDIAGKIIYWNRYATNLYQWQAEEVIGKNIYEGILSQNSHQQIDAILEQVVQLGSWQGELLVKPKDDSYFWVELTYSALKDPDDIITGWVVVSVNATERKQVEESLHQNTTTTQVLFELLPDAMFHIRKDGTILDFKAAKEFSTRLSPQKFIGKKLSKILPKELANQAIQQIERSLASSRLRMFEYQMITPCKLIDHGQDRGELRDFEARIIPSGAEEVLAIVRDVTERKRAEEQLSKREERYRVVSELISDFAYAGRIDINSRLVMDWIAGALSRISGFSWEEIEARGGWQSLIHPEDQSLFREHVQALLFWQSDVSDYRIFTKDGEIRWIRDYSQPVHCEEEDQVLLIYGAAQDITERKQAEEALRQQTERERLMRRMQERIRQSLHLDEILNKVVEEVRSFLQVERVTIYQIDPRGSGKFVVESVASGSSSVLGIPLIDPCFDNEYAQKYKQGRISAVDDINRANLADCYVQLLAQIQIRAMLLVPIVFNNQLWGLLCAHQCSQPRHWEPFEIDSLQQLATQVAIAIQQSELYQQIQKLNAALEQQVQERTQELQKALDYESTLKRIADKVRVSLDESQILQTTVQELGIALGMSGCNASLYDLENGTSTICYEYTDKSIPEEQGRVAVMANFPELYQQLLKEQYILFCSDNPVRGRVAMLAYPIFDDKGVLGDLWLINNSEYIFSDLEVRLVHQVTIQCAIAIRQARLYQAAQAQVAELAKLNQLKDDFVSAVSHELRTPMANMKMAIQMLQLAPNPDQRQRYLEILQSECKRETELINDLLELQRLEAGSHPLMLSEAVNVPEWLPTIVDPFYARAHNHQQTLQVELPSDLNPLISNQAALGRIVAELLNNACKYTIAGGAIILEVWQHPYNSDRKRKKAKGTKSNSPSPIPDTLLSTQRIPLNAEVPTTIFTVSNQAEIPASELPHVFDKFYRVPKTDLWKQGGTGLGLALVKKLVEQMGGTIQVESTNGWTALRVELPTKP